MSIEIRVPQLPESVADATLMAWRKQPGEAVSRDENLADLETDKVVLDVPAPVNGVLREIKVPAGQSVKAGDLLAVIDEGAVATAAPAAAVQATAASAPAANGKAPAAAAAAAPKTGPAARRVIEENHLAAGNITASAPGGHLTKLDVEAAVRAGAVPLTAPSPAPSAPT
ncbi:MAG TPA: biotin/lipoyl-containing protein, partial [Steroidobacteraceae bacterium]